jgi:hypothetical protein
MYRQNKSCDAGGSWCQDSFVSRESRTHRQSNRRSQIMKSDAVAVGRDVTVSSDTVCADLCLKLILRQEATGSCLSLQIRGRGCSVCSVCSDGTGQSTVGMLCRGFTAAGPGSIPDNASSILLWGPSKPPSSRYWGREAGHSPTI